MTQITIIDEVARHVDATPDPGRGTFLVDADRLPEALGWELKPSGLCRADSCVPVPDTGGLKVGGQLDLVAVARALGRAVVVDLDAGLVAVSLPAELRRQALVDLRAPAFELPDVDDEPPPARRLARDEEAPGHILELVRLPVRPARLAGAPRRAGPRRLHRGRRGHRPFGRRCPAVDRTASPCRSCTTPIISSPSSTPSPTCPRWCGSTRRTALCAPTGVPSAATSSPSSPGSSPGPHLDEVRRWVRQGIVPVTEDEARQAVGDLSPDEVLARLHFRVAAEAHRQGDRADHPAPCGPGLRAGPGRPHHLAGRHAPGRRGPVRRLLPGPVRGVEAAGHAVPRPPRGDAPGPAA